MDVNADFNPRAPCGARLSGFVATGYHLRISIHAPRAGRDPPEQTFHRVRCISIHAPRAGRDQPCRLFRQTRWISIHAPRAGRDFRTIKKHEVILISIHAPRAGRDYRKQYFQAGQ